VHLPDYSVLVLGLDGATFDLLRPWAKQGYLPCLGRLLDQGASSPLRSTIPPITPCAWSSFMTGKNPGKHGLFDFIEPVAGTHTFRFTNAASRRGETLWGCLGRHGRRVGVINVPMTYPPEPVNGYLISGLDTPGDQSPYAHPDSLREELRAAGIPYRIDIQHLGDMRTDALRDRRLQELCEIETVRTQALAHLQERYPSDFTMLVYSATDAVQHHFWHYMDPRHDKYDERGAERYRNAIRDVYIHIDRLLASVLEKQDDKTLVIVMSDHGFGPTTNVRLRLNQFLQRQGLLTFREEGSSGRLFRSLAGWADRLLRSSLSGGIKRKLAGLFPRLRIWFENLDEAAIDWPRTLAYTHEAYRSCPSIWANRTQLASEQGEPADGALLERVLQLTEKALLDLTDRETGQAVISHVYRSRNLYRGPFVDKAPDLIPSWWEDGFLLEQSHPDGPAALDVVRSRDRIEGGVEFAGSHRLDGVFMMAGGPVRPGHDFQGAQIIDVAPTVLYLMGLPIPDDMDGRPLLEALEPEFVACHPPQYERDGASPNESSNGDGAFSSEEAQLIEARLQSLGYIE
jgi:predicted AlkP superfamily phosphohydrolase/phosphomutase